MRTPSATSHSAKWPTTPSPDRAAEAGAALAGRERREFTRGDRRPPLGGDDASSFRHTPLRKVAYNPLPKAERRARHAAVAHFLEASHPNSSVALAPMLGSHW